MEVTDFFRYDCNPVYVSSAEEWGPYTMATTFTVHTWGLGLATSTDGRSWTRDGDEPILDLTCGTGGVRAWCWTGCTTCSTSARAA